MSKADSPSNLGYLVPEFPGQTHAFFWREFSALQDLVASAVMLSTRPPREGKGEHAFVEPASRITRYLMPPGVGEVAWLAAHPGRLRRARAYLSSLSPADSKTRLKRWGILLCAAKLKRIADQQRITHIHVHSCSEAAHLAALCRRLGGPTFGLTLHGDLEVYGKDHPQKSAEAAYVTAVTRPLRRQLIELAGVPEDRVPVIWMGVDTDRFSPRENGRAEGPVRLITVARLHPCKGHAHALRALRTAIDGGADLHYDIAGRGPAESELRQEIQRLKLEDRVTLLGSIGEETVLEKLRASDVFVLPSVGLGEAAPVSVMEAMACGLPVVCSIIGGTRDMISDGEDGYLVEQGDEARLAEAFAELAGSDEHRRRLGQAARRRAEQQFDYRSQAARLAEWVAWAQRPQLPAPNVDPSAVLTDETAMAPAHQEQP